MMMMMMESKRSAVDDVASAIVPSKKPKQGHDVGGREISARGPGGAIQVAGPARTSSLLAPVMTLEGHEGEILSCKYSPNGKYIASGGFDRMLFLWQTFGECENYAALQGHTGAIFDVSWNSSSDSSAIRKSSRKVYSVGTDKTCMVWDAEVGERIRRLRGHSDFVNSCCAARNNDVTCVTGADDGTIRVWDSRQRNAIHSLNNKYQVMAVCLCDDGERIISGGLDNTIKIWDLRTLGMTEQIKGHTDSVTGLALSPNGKEVLSTSMDGTVCVWDVQPFVSGHRLRRTLFGSHASQEKNLIKCAWTPDGKHVGSGSGDRNVYVWNVFRQQIAYCLPGHKGTVNQIDFHPEEPIVLSCSSDKKLFQGELQL